MRGDKKQHHIVTNINISEKKCVRHLITILFRLVINFSDLEM